MVAVQVDRVGNWVTRAVRVHQEHLDHLGERESLHWEKVKVNDQSESESRWSKSDLVERGMKKMEASTSTWVR